MPRLLIVGKKIARLNCVDWSEWQAHNLLDYPGLLLDCRRPARISKPTELSSLLFEYLRQGQSLYLILPESSEVPPAGMAFDLLPRIRLNIYREKGKTLKEVISAPPFLQYRQALNGHEIIIGGAQPMLRPGEPSWQWRAAITDNVNRAVCGIYGNSYVFHPPSRGLEEQAFKAILEHFRPDFEEPEPEEPPEWSTKLAAQIPGVAEIESRMAKTSLEIENLSSQLAVDESKRQELQRSSEMLWLTGVRLQTRVSEALAFLGVQNESKNPTGHMEDLEGTCLGRPVIFEVTASAGSIGVEKARQLLQWIGESADPTNRKSVLIGNAYRNEPPEKRPPTPDHKIFVKEAEDMAQKFHFGLLDVQNLFELVLRKLSGEDIRAEWICERLQTDGLIKFGNQ